MKHLSEEQIECYVANRVPGQAGREDHPAVREIEEHYLGCGACWMSLELEESTVWALKDALGREARVGI